MELGTTKYIIYAELMANGYVEKHDIIGAIFGQTEGLLSSDLDLRDLQKSGRIGRIDVELDNTNGKSYAKIILPSSLDKVETAILAATLETIDRVGPCLATVRVVNVEDIRIKKRQYITNRAKELLKTLIDNMVDTYEITEEIKEYIRTEEIIEYGEEKLPAGPNIDNSDAIIVVEGRADVINLLRCGIKNVIAVEGTSIPKSIMELSREKTTTIFTDGDRGGELILKEAIQTCDIDYIARAPHGKEVEELSKKEVVKYLRSKIPIEQYIQLNANKSHVMNNYSSGVINNGVITNTQSINDLASGICNEEKVEGMSGALNNNDVDNNENINNNMSQALNKSEVSELKNKEEIKETHDNDKKDGNSNQMSYEIFKTDDYAAQLNYIKSSMEEILGTNKVKIIGDGFEEIKSIEELNEYVDKLNIDFFISDVPITQKIVDLFYKTTSVMIGREINIAKKPANLRIFSYDSFNQT
ncbi:DNA primase DnaG [Methanothermococcus sp.]|uniref:DNA primase DnaG n=1 Tax=Methanothermococcus sp. TaxID=2614238 RepID=UPI0025ECD539|nr:DNA primase DnaG [Methanothermococcus sp.]